ncbi:class I SAM-dependent methyltransferase [Kitasatospora sp. Ki12]|uniref:class I SAM-dependent DNA methyltransferase n=1 Tax=Kitasatospora xanthocidica TaxID=83382 RepID=UPI001672C12C|nr:class I SAM-dependent methyltransferase [Kitasatospora xanthocidica]GHF36014.1 methyltransferase [Kitasatospora xanthocidica]
MNAFQGWDAASYGDARATVYDRQVAGRGDVPEAVGLLAELAGDGPALELGVGTGRLAIPLAAKGVPVHGLDSSPKMLEELGRAPGGDRVVGVPGSMTDFALEESFTLVWVAFNSLFLVDDPREQENCFRSVAGHLAEGGRFVVEAFVPAPEQFDGAAALRVKDFGSANLLLQVSRHDADAQVVESLDLEVTADGFALYPTRVRYSWPEELDAMAGRAGLRLEDRWENWSRHPFTAGSRSHVSVYTAADTASGRAR